MKIIVHHGGSYSTQPWDSVYEFPDFLSYLFPKTYFTEKEWKQFKEKEKQNELKNKPQKTEERNYFLDVYYATLLILSIFLLIILIINLL